MTVEEFKTDILNCLQLHGYKKLGFSISGGLDSAVVLYIFCDLITAEQKKNSSVNEIEIIPITGADSRLEVVNNVLNFIKAAFPNIVFKDPHFISYQQKDFRTKWANYHVPYHVFLYDNDLIDVLIHCGTRNIPESELEKLDFNKNGIDKNRSLDDGQKITVCGWRPWPDAHYGQSKRAKNKEPGYPQWNILMNYNKKLTAGFYSELNLHESLAKLTWSCTGVALRDIYNTETGELGKPCGTCYWCAEKKWAFGYN